jgi:hypothetical protein
VHPENARTRGASVTTRSISLLLLLSALAACRGSDVVGVHLRIVDGGPAVLTTRSLLVQEEPGPVEALAEGVAWRARARLVCSRGEVADLKALRLAGITFEPGPGRLRVTIPCGPETSWVEKFAPPADARLAALEVYDPKGDDRSAGTSVLFEVEVPALVVAAGAAPGWGGVSTDHQGRRATLLLPAKSVREQERVLVWDVTW